jgi:hypothetical protein
VAGDPGDINLQDIEQKVGTPRLIAEMGGPGARFACESTCKCRRLCTCACGGLGKSCTGIEVVVGFLFFSTESRVRVRDVQDLHISHWRRTVMGHLSTWALQTDSALTLQLTVPSTL